MFWGADDFARARQRLNELDETRVAGERARLGALSGLVETAGCRRALLLRYFGEEPPEACGNCDNCLNAPQTVDATELARKYLSAVFRTGQMFGAGYVESVLTGQSSERSLRNGHEALSVWGIVETGEAALLKGVGRALLLKDALRANPHGGLEFGPAARAILKGEAPLAMVMPPRRERRKRRDGAAANPVGDPLFDALRACRRELAEAAGVPPYVVFHDSTLREMAAARPQSLAALGEITGIGARKLDAYGDAFLGVLRQF
jgi:ATP-dependent DNA helicase RecQ